ncbi:MAG TPA: WYL domain-containing protein [Spirochaetota bacterium]|nr:WYL domain-containing protein [Spirochaetota bacterium]HPJ42379.1 WYL domain-containing protein [Spirochaetota bacterium]HPR37300.1 WYL domain-containing protein [Spirochaetota bacterium]
MTDIRIADKVSKTQFSLFMRQLHILALVQHSSLSENMNCGTMSSLLSTEPGKDDVTEKMIRDSVARLIEMGFPVQMEKGAPRVGLERELTDTEMLEILPYYLNIVSDTMGIRDCFKSYVGNHGSRSLWIIARIYFAACEKKQIKLIYRSKNKSGAEEYTLNPYRWIYRDNAVYLIARNVARDVENISLFRLNRIRDLRVTESIFDDDIPPADELMQYSIGAFMSSRLYDIRIRFRPEEKESIEEDFGHLDVRYSDDKDGYVIGIFRVCDLINLCKAVFSYSGRVKIIEPPEAVEQMRELLENNIKAL